ncbi:MAG: hypothetical protein KY462_14665 [Actinobacteria bacterium]|nr:hypothetical protein [Actinomycetota bacterium]
MIVCSNCGFHNEDGARFCGHCREFLQWTGRTVEEASEPEPEAEPAAEDAAAKGVVERVVEKLTGKDQRDERASTTLAAARRIDADATPAGEEGTGEDAAAALQAETAARADEEARQAQRRRQEAEALAREQAEATERARQRADEAERARRAADEQARKEAEAMEQAQRELQAARAAREEKQEQLRRELEAAEAARKEAEERARAEAEAAEAAAGAAAEAEEARRTAEAKAQEEAEAAERARRAAAMVARPKPVALRRPAPAPADPFPTAKARPVPETATSWTATEPVDGAPQPTAPAPDKPAPKPVKPGRSRARPTARGSYGPPTRKPRPGDLICGVCGESNGPARNFCRRCGNSLAEAEVARPPWWRRLLPKRYAAGERPGHRGAKAKGRAAMKGARGIRRFVMGGVGKVTRLLMLVAFALGAVGISFNPGLRGSVMGWGSDVFRSVRAMIAPQFEPVLPVGAEASSSLPDHPPDDAINNTSNRWWAEAAPGNGEGQRLLITFPEPVDIAVVGVTPGAANPEEFIAQPRPRLLHLVFSNGTTADLRIADEHTFQTFNVTATGVTSVEVQIIEAWQGQSGSDLAITTIEFRTRR